jgi:hypothetical protein
VKHRIAFINLSLVAVFLVLTSTAALASNTWYVDGVNGSDNNNCKSRQHACKTIGHAISLASSGDSIMVAAATYTENLSISFSLKIVGAGASTTSIQREFNFRAVVTISNTAAHVSLSKVTISNGGGSRGGGIYNGGTLTIDHSIIGNNYAIVGGGIYNVGTVTINNSTLSFNIAAFATRYGGGVGGGIFSDGALTINNSTISNNTAQGVTNEGNGGGIYNATGTLRINNSTISGNTANSRNRYNYGGGIYNYGGGTLTVNNSTLSGNTSTYGGGISGSATLQNSIVANNPSGGNCYGGVTSNGYNLSSDGTCNFNGTGDLNNTDPKLGQLGNYGGPTQTIPLLSGSPAIDSGNPKGCTDGQGNLLKTDQRGKPRPDKEDTGGCDRGAYERQND